MDHKSVYHALIQKAVKEQKDGIRRKLSREDGDYIYYESHHILPRSLGGSNEASNLVLLTGREHYIAHKLLYLMTKGTPEGFKMACAWNYMCYGRRGSDKVYSSREYEEARNVLSQELTLKWEDPELRLKASEEMELRWKDPEYREKMSNLLIDRWKYDEEFSEMMSNATSLRNTLNWKDEDYRSKMEGVLEEVRNDPEHKLRMSKLAEDRWKNASWSKETSKRISEGKLKASNRNYEKEADFHSLIIVTSPDGELLDGKDFWKLSELPSRLGIENYRWRNLFKASKSKKLVSRGRYKGYRFELHK